MIDDEEWKKNIEAKLLAMKQELESKIDQSNVEIIQHQQNEKILREQRKSQGRSFKTYMINADNSDPEAACVESAKAGDLETAFLIALRHIETTTNIKSDKKEIENKATLAYAESLFERLNIISNEQIKESTKNLKQSIETLFSEMYEELEETKSEIELNVSKMESRVSSLQIQVYEYALSSKPQKKEIKNQVFGEKQSHAPISERNEQFHRQFLRSRAANKGNSNIYPEKNFDVVITPTKKPVKHVLSARTDE